MIWETDLDTLFKQRRNLIPEITIDSKIKGKTRGKTTLNLIKYDENENPIGYKSGYALTDTTFYSYVGGVHVDHRRSGIATMLLRNMEEWCVSRNYKYLECTTRNINRAMLNFLINEDFCINGYEERGHIMNADRISFVKELR